ncbi:sigma-70 family RNA polymerase sigma factor [Pararhodobacter sp. CCB-MM2]|uniref:sigma-70 family RNA polymerase sigma factor n=1 Tax=Pararhodobacter sp. CCB-MM2 TaxID=1786003 RepID=UPI0008324F5C|nr:sigma-70 family RNA polymerase sigma factor [Pararhodobacter sp. CCB-MM2]MCA2014273.1 sigma-70 family RNA polymerase sigma factor [Cereibacter sphaeroides]
MTDDPIGRLLQATATHDRDAFRHLYAETSPKLSGVLHRILGNRTEVDDAMQEIYVRVWQRAAQYRPERGAGLSWLIAVARNHALDRLRARPERQGLRQEVARDADGQDPLDRVADSAAGVEDRLVARGEARRVMDCFDELENDRAAAVRGAYIEGMSYLDLSERHGVPLNTMRTWLRRGLIRLRECMDR